MAGPRGDETGTAERATPAGAVPPAPPLGERLVERAVDVALAAAPVPRRVLDVACRDGAVLRALCLRLPTAEEFAGVDASEEAVAGARRVSDPRLRFSAAPLDALPLPDAHVDLAVCAAGVDGWAPRVPVLTELRRVLHPAGRLVLVDVRAPRAELGADAVTAGLTVLRRETATRLLGLPRSRAYVLGRSPS